MLWRETTRIIAAIEQQGVKIMAAIDDLKSAVTRLNTSTTTELRAVAAALTNQGDSADVEAAATAINAAADQLDAETASLTGTPAPTTTAAPSV